MGVGGKGVSVGVGVGLAVALTSTVVVTVGSALLSSLQAVANSSKTPASTVRVSSPRSFMSCAPFASPCRVLSTALLATTHKVSRHDLRQAGTGLLDERRDTPSPAARC